jgi:hypothetical protein
MVISSVKADFLNAYAKCTVDDCQPLNVGESKSFNAMIHLANPKIIFKKESISLSH